MHPVSFFILLTIYALLVYEHIGNKPSLMTWLALFAFGLLIGWHAAELIRHSA